MKLHLESVKEALKGPQMTDLIARHPAPWKVDVSQREVVKVLDGRNEFVLAERLTDNDNSVEAEIHRLVNTINRSAQNILESA